MDREREARSVELAWLAQRTEAEWDDLVSYTSLAPNQIKNSPWKLPENHKDAETVNKILGEIF